MNTIAKRPLARLGYDFVEARYLPPGKDEHYLREAQSAGVPYRALTPGDVQRVAAQYLNDANRIVISIVPEGRQDLAAKEDA